MTYDLDQFCADLKTALSGEQDDAALETVRTKLEGLLENEQFIAATCGEEQPGGINTLYEDPDLGFMVLAHINDQGRTSPPHDHGRSWAVYGQAVKYTEMTEYDRADDGNEAGRADVNFRRTYRLDPGMAGKFGPRQVHSIHFPDGARFIRVTGTDLNKIPSLKFDMDAKTVTEVDPLQAGGPAGQT